MIRIVLSTLCALCLTASVTATAQTDESTKPMWGVRASFDLNFPGDYHFDGGSVKMFSHSYGFTVGVVNNIYLGRNFYFEPGVSFFYDQAKFDNITISEDIPSDLTSGYKLGLRIPLSVGYSVNINDRIGLSFYTGPELNITCDSKCKAKDAKGNTEDFDLLDITSQRPVDLAWTVGVGVPCGSFFVSVSGSFGLTDLHKGSAMTYRENRANIGLTYYF